RRPSWEDRLAPGPTGAPGRAEAATEAPRRPAAEAAGPRRQPPEPGGAEGGPRARPQLLVLRLRPCRRSRARPARKPARPRSARAPSRPAAGATAPAL